jgi:hypothetical protein
VYLHASAEEAIDRQWNSQNQVQPGLPLNNGVVAIFGNPFSPLALCLMLGSIFLSLVPLGFKTSSLSFKEEH